MRTRLLVPALALVLAVVAVLASTCERERGRPLGPAFLFFVKVDSTRIDFGPVAVGASATRQLTITNVGDAPLAGEVAAPCPEFDVIEGRGAYVLAPAESLLVSVRFRPTSAGPKSCRLATGSRCTPVDLVGEGTGGGGGGDCEVDPIVIDFGLVPVGETADSTFTLRNLGDSQLSGAVVASCPGWSLGTGGGSFSLPPGDSLVVQVIFAPGFPGPQGCPITTGLLRCPVVACTGTGTGSDSLDCSQALSIAFNQPLTGNNTGAATNVSTYACTPFLSEWGAEVVYRLVLPSPASITATLDNLSADLDLFLLSACDADSCLAAAVLPSTNPDVITTSLGAGAYYLVVDGYLGATSAYRIQVVPGAGGKGGAAAAAR